MYYKSGYRKMGNYLNDNEIGKHVTLYDNGKVEITNYNN